MYRNTHSSAHTQSVLAFIIRFYLRRSYFNGRNFCLALPLYFDGLRLLLIPFSFTYWYFMYKMRVHNDEHI